MSLYKKNNWKKNKIELQESKRTHKYAKHQQKKWNKQQPTLSKSSRLAAKQRATEEAQKKHREGVKEQLREKARSLPIIVRCRAFSSWFQGGSFFVSKGYRKLKNRKLAASERSARSKIVQKWLRKYRLRRVLRRKRGRIPFTHTPTQQQYFARLPSAMTYKFGARTHYTPFLCSAHSLMQRPRPVWKPYAATPKALWNFFENYRKYECRWLTATWREEQLLRLTRWVHTNVRFSNSSTFFVRDTIYRALKRIATKNHPEERRARRAQRALTKWFKKTNIQSEKSFLWLHEELERVWEQADALHRVCSAKSTNLTDWPLMKRLIRMFARKTLKKLPSVPLRPSKPSSNAHSKFQKHYKNEMKVFTKQQQAAGRIYRQRRFDKKTARLSRILWRFISPEFWFKSGRLPTRKIKGLQPIKKELIPYLEKRNWLNFAKHPLQQGYYQEKYVVRKFELIGEFKEAKMRLLKRVWLPYREKTPRYFPSWKRRYKRRYGRRRRAFIFPAAIQPVYTARLAKPRQTLLPLMKLSFGLQRHFSTERRAPKTTEKAGKETAAHKDAESKKHRSQKPQSKASASTFMKKNNVATKSVSQQKKAKKKEPRSQPFFTNKKTQKSRRRRRRTKITRADLKRCMKLTWRQFFKQKRLKARRRRNLLSASKLRRKPLRLMSFRRKSLLRQKRTTAARPRLFARKVRRPVSARLLDKKFTYTLRQRLSKKRPSICKAKKPASARLLNKKFLHTARQRSSKKRPPARLRWASTRKGYKIALSRLCYLRSTTPSATVKSAKTLVSKKKVRYPWEWTSITKVIKRKKPLKLWKYKRRGLPLCHQLKCQRKLTTRRATTWQKKRAVIATTLVRGNRVSGRKVKALTRWLHRLRNRRRQKQRRLSSRQSIRTLPLVLPTNEFSGPFDRALKGVWLSRRKNRKLNRLRPVLQWQPKTKKVNKRLAQRFLTLQLRNQAGKSLKRLRSRTAAILLGSTTAPLPTFGSSDDWPFAPKRNKMRQHRVVKRLLDTRSSAEKAYLSSALLQNELTTRRLAKLAILQRARQLSSQIRGTSWLSDFDKRKYPAVRFATKTPAPRVLLKSRSRIFSKSRRRILRSVKKRAKWATTKEKGQHRTFKRILKKRLRPRGRHWFRGFKKKPTKRKHRNIFVVSRKTSKRQAASQLRQRHLGRLRVKRPRARRLLKLRVAKYRFRKWRARRKIARIARRRSKKQSVFRRKLKRAIIIGQKMRFIANKSVRMASFWQKLKRSETRAHLLRLPHTVPQYRLRSRLIAKGGYRHLSREQQTNQKNKNKDRHIAALRLHKARSAVAARWNKTSPFFKWASSVQYEEKFKQNIHRKNWSPMGDSKVTARAGYPGVIGVRRYRRTFVAKFNKNRWWKPSPLPLPHAHPLSLQSRLTAVPARITQLFHAGPVKVIASKALTVRESRKQHKKENNVLRLLTPATNGKRQKSNFVGELSSRSLFFTEAPIWKNNTNWELLEKGLINNKNNLRSLAGRRLNKKLNVLLSALNPRDTAWTFYSKKHSAHAVAVLQAHFINSASRWVQERPLEKLISSWNKSTWARFKHFTELQKTVNSTKVQTLAAFRSSFIKTARRALLTLNSNWWEKEAKTRAAALLKEVAAGLQPAVVLKNLKTSVGARALFDSQAGYSWQEKKVLAFFVSQLPTAESADYLSEFENSATRSNSLDEKPFSPLYNRWLTAVETYLQKNRTARSSQDYNDFRGNYITEVGIEQPRFPGTGRQRKTFDALLRRHYSFVMPLRRRRLKRRTLQKLRLSNTTSFVSRAPRFESSAKQRRSQKQTKKFLTLPYLTTRRRELTNRMLHQRKESAPRRVAIKTLFASLPLRLLKALKESRERRFRAKEITNFSGIAESLVQSALRKRFVTRRIRDLRKSSARRKFLRNRSVPFWIQRKLDRKASRAARISRYYLSKFFGRANTKSKNWVFSEFALRTAKNMARSQKVTTSSGEILNIRKKIVRRTHAIIRRRGIAGARSRKPNRAVYLTNPKIRPTRRYKYKRSKNRYRGYRKPIKRTALSIEKKWLHRVEKARLSTQYKFIKYTRPSMVLSPLHFHQPTTRVSITAEDKERWRLHIQATRLRKYRRLTEVSESLTSFFPQMISWFLSKKLNGRTVSPKVAANWVSGMYWSLRMYLNYDFTNTKSGLRDTGLPRLQLLKKEVTALSDNRYFDLSSLRGARYRFQPYTLHHAGSLRRGALEWLRQFLPNFYELYLEDPEKYKHLTLTPIKVFRSHLSSRATSNWETRNVPGTMEQRYNRLTTSRYGKNSTRFENMLMTTRRTPVLGGYGAAAALQVISPVGSSTTRHSFFRRHFSSQASSTASHPDFRTLSVVTSRAHLLRRHTTTEIQTVSHSAGVRALSKTKPGAVAKARAHNMPSGRDGASGSLDVRIIRAKSPRSADYIRRLPVARSHIDSSAILSHRTFLSERASANLAGRQVVDRDNRAIRAISILDGSESTRLLPLNTSSYLQQYRREIVIRRSPALLKSRRAAASRISKVKLKIGRRLFTKRQRLYRRFLKAKVRIQKNLKISGGVKKIKSVRSILSFRKAAQRSPKKLYRAKSAILMNAIQLRRRLWNSFRLGNVSKILFSKHKKQLPKNKAYLAFVPRYNKIKGPDPVFTKKIKAAARKVTTGYSVGVVKRLFFAPGRRTPFNLLLGKRATTRGSLKKHFVNSNFIHHAKAIHSNLTLLSKYANRVERERSRSMFSERRPELWKMLTFRWNKKFRYLKKWLRNIKYAFKQHYWSYRGEHILPDELFKLARIRLRKLDWRESDELFYRQGLKHAFTFHPRERSNTRWLEPLLLRRSLYNLRRGEYRRYQFPREQKNRKWLQKLRKLLFRSRPSRMYIKGRRWPLLRMYNQRLSRSVFHIRNSKAALKRFRKLARRKASETGFEKLMTGFGDRLDVNLMLLNIAPTTFWARIMSRMGLLRVNGKVIREPSFRFRPGDFIEWAWDKIQQVRINFKSPLKRFNRTDTLRETSLHFPGNFEYSPKLRAARYLRLPRAEDLAEAGRVNECLFRWFQLDSGLGRN